MRRLTIILLISLFPIALLASGYRAVVIPVEFSDLTFKNTSTGVQHKATTAGRYFTDQFSPSLSFSFEVLPTVRLSMPYAWYGANSSTLKDIRIGELIREATKKCGVNLSVYDNDGDGFIDNIYIVAAGNSEAEGSGADHLWPQQAKLSERGEAFQADGKTVDNFAVCTETSSPGVFCHEFAHVLGLQDMYDTDGSGSGGLSNGLWGTLSLMDKGIAGSSDCLPPNFCAIELEQLGLGTRIASSLGPRRLRPVSSYKEYLRIDSDTDGEYYLIECRKEEGWDAGIGGGGLVIYHIDRSENNSWYSDLYMRNLSARERWDFNQVNCRPDHPCARVITAIPSTTELSRIFFPQPGHNSFASDTDPAFGFWNGEASNLALDNITLESDGSVRFNLIAPVSVMETHVFQDAMIINWKTADVLDVRTCNVLWYKNEARGNVQLLGSAVAQRQEDGMFFTVIEDLEPSTDYSIFIRALSQNGRSYSKTIQLSTKGIQKGVRPFIYLNTLKRREDGSFYVGDKIPMRVYNLEGADQVLWYFNGMRMRPESDGYWHLTQSGTLKVEIWYEDDSMEIITRKMIVR